jgi:hypothetical protein
MSRIRRILTRLNRKLKSPSQEEKYLANATCLSTLEYRQRNIQRGHAPYQKNAAMRSSL